MERGWKLGVGLLILGSLLVATLSYRHISSSDFDQAIDRAQSLSRLTYGKDGSSYVGDEILVQRLFEDSYNRTGRLPTPDELQELTMAAINSKDALPELLSRKTSYLNFLDTLTIVIAGLMILVLVLGWLVKKRQ